MRVIIKTVCYNSPPKYIYFREYDRKRFDQAHKLAITKFKTGHSTFQSIIDLYANYIKINNYNVTDFS